MGWKMSVPCSLAKDYQMMNLIHDKHKSQTVFEACLIIEQMGFGHVSLVIEGYDTRRKWTFAVLKGTQHVYHPRIGRFVSIHSLKANDLRIRWVGGPPRNRQIYTGTLLMCVIDLILYEEAINNEINVVQCQTHLA